MDTRSGIYQIRHVASGKVYVGSAVHFHRRMGLHRRELRNGTHHSAKLQRAWDKHGEGAFVFEVLEAVEDVSLLLAREQVWLDALQACRRGYNVAPTAGSLLGHRLSAASRARMSAAQSGVPKTPEHVAKVRAALLGRTMTEDQRQKMRDAKLGSKRGPHSDEHRAKIAAAHRGRTFSPEHRAKLAVAKQGRTLSAETRARMSAAQKARHASVPT